VNAFAVPGGFIVVHDAILDEMEHHEELAGLLGHEIGHVQLRHSTKAIARSLSYYMLLSLLFGDVSGIAAVIVDNASTLNNLEY
ncbi:M48 family metalloprotease, partial [Klebsiella pneumoniae]